MNIILINILFIGFMISEIQIVSVFGHCPYSVTFSGKLIYLLICAIVIIICNVCKLIKKSIV